MRRVTPCSYASAPIFTEAQRWAAWPGFIAVPLRVCRQARTGSPNAQRMRPVLPSALFSLGACGRNALLCQGRIRESKKKRRRASRSSRTWWPERETWLRWVGSSNAKLPGQPLCRPIRRCSASAAAIGAGNALPADDVEHANRNIVAGAERIEASVFMGKARQEPRRHVSVVALVQKASPGIGVKPSSPLTESWMRVRGFCSQRS